MAYMSAGIFDLLDDWTSLDISRDLFDSRDLMKARKEAEADQEHEPEHEGEAEALAAIIKLVGAIETEVGSDEWPHGITFIPRRDFAEYTQDTALDIGRVTEEQMQSWPFSCIDWERAAEELSQDYGEIEIDGTPYLYRY